LASLAVIDLCGKLNKIVFTFITAVAQCPCHLCMGSVYVHVNIKYPKLSKNGPCSHQIPVMSLMLDQLPEVIIVMSYAIAKKSERNGEGRKEKQ
jgi:hypothetical protein